MDITRRCSRTESCLILILSESFASKSWANRNVTWLLNSFTFPIDIGHYFIYDWSELFLFSLFYSDKEDLTVSILVGSFTNWVCYPVDNEWNNSVLFESITILVFLVVTVAHNPCQFARNLIFQLVFWNPTFYNSNLLWATHHYWI